jgi:hypothetical protein
MIVALWSLARVRLLTGRLPEVQPLLLQALSIVERNFGRDDPIAGDVLEVYVDLLRRQKRRLASIAKRDGEGNDGRYVIDAQTLLHGLR